MNKKIVNAVLGLAILVIAGWLAYDFFGIEKRLAVHGAIQDILGQRDMHGARTTLEGVNDRAFVIEKLREALDDDSATVWGKVGILQTLNQWRERRTVLRALDSDDLSTRRAAAFYWHDDKEYKTQVSRIALEWIEDEGADSRNLAAKICNRLKLEEAVPTLMAVLDQRAVTDAERALLTESLRALTSLKPEGLGPKVFAIARDTAQDPQTRAAAFDVVGQLPDAPKAEVRDFMIDILLDESAHNLRHNAARVLGKKDYANERAWKALTDTLLGENPVKNGVIQRSCLYALGVSLPFDRIEELLLNRKVYNHPYFGIRVDVSTGLAMLRSKKQVVLDIMCEYLVDKDAGDTLNMVRQEAWLTLWTLTGIAYGVSEPQQFRNPPKAMRDKQVKRDFLFRPAQIRPGVTRAQVEILESFTGNLEEMQKIRQVYQNQIPTILEAWKKQDEEAEEEEKGVKAVQDLIAILDKPAVTDEEKALLRKSLKSLASLEPKGLGPMVIAILRDTKQDSETRVAAIDLVSALPDAPKKEVQDSMIEMLFDESAHNLRHNAARVLGRKEYADERAWKALTDMLLGESTEKNEVLHRSCLYALGASLPLDRIEELLLNRKVHDHRYFGIRVDVATGLAMLRSRKKVVLDIMCEYLVNQDDRDTQNMVRQEAWLTLWTLTGIAHGVPEPEKFGNPPKATADKAVLRDYLFRPAQIRPGVTPAQVRVLASFTGNLEEMQKIRQAYQDQIPTVLEAWKKKDGNDKGKPPGDPTDKNTTKDGERR